MISKTAIRLALVIIFLNILESFGQSRLKYWMAGIYASSQIHSGYISSSNFSFMPGPGVGFSLKSSYFNRIHIGADVGYILLKNQYTPDQSLKWRLTTANIELLPSVEVNFRSFGKYMRKNTSSPYLKFAPSFNVFQPRLSDIYNFDDSYDFFPYSYLSVGWYIGAGYKFLIKNNYLLQIEFFFNNMNTNKASGFNVEGNFITDRYAGIRAIYSFVKF